METFFAPPEYHTPADVKPHWKFRFLPGTTFLLLSDLVFGLMLKTRRKALNNQLTSADLSSICTQFAHQCERTGVKIHITGLDNIATDASPCVFVGNHMSTLETFLLPGIVHPFKPVTFVVKESILKQRLFGPIMKSMDPIPVNRRDPKADLKKVLDEGIKTLKQGTSLIIFPQTTRTAVFDPSLFNTLGEKLAKRAGVPIVPVAVKTDFWSPGKVFKELGTIAPEKDIHISFGKPMDSAINPKQLHQDIIDTIVEKLTRWGVTVVSTP
ncbi:MAG: lysophospholipid acyltransferase family protein [Lentisphaeria bacterium]|nr:lysophospholipid acyltransferase family protein [Lentisphaeria bacterium]